MTIVHHLDDATVLAYAAGTLGEALSTAASIHISMCPQCREALRDAEALGGEIFEGLEANAVSDTCRSATFLRLDATAGVAARQSRSPLEKLLGGKDLAHLPWRRKAPGFSVIDVPLSAKTSGSLKLLKIASGMRMLEHGHGGGELTLVLQGAFRDEVGRFSTGDIADLDQETEHCPVIEAGEDCICLFATQAPSRHKTLLGRLLQPFTGV